MQPERLLDQAVGPGVIGGVFIGRLAGEDQDPHRRESGLATQVSGELVAIPVRQPYVDDSQQRSILECQLLTLAGGVGGVPLGLPGVIAAETMDSPIQPLTPGAASHCATWVMLVPMAADHPTTTNCAAVVKGTKVPDWVGSIYELVN